MPDYNNHLIITIDGPTASGKSTMARMLADKLAFQFLSTGLLYRSLAYLLVNHCGLLEKELHNPDVAHLKACLNSEHFNYHYGNGEKPTVFFKGENITPHLKTPLMDQYSSILGAVPIVRQHLLQVQHDLAAQHNLVVEGRDIGTVVFPDAPIKFYLTASVDARARRWQQYQEGKGRSYSMGEARAFVTERDRRDQERQVSPLVVPEGAIVVDNTDMSPEQTLDRMYEEVVRYQKQHARQDVKD